MRKRDRRHAPWLAVLLVLLLLGGAAAAYFTGIADRWLANERPDPVTEPAAVPPPEGMELPAVRTPDPVAEEAKSGRLRPAAIRRTLASGLRDNDLGRSVHATVAGLGDGPPAYATGNASFTPASTSSFVVRSRL